MMGRLGLRSRRGSVRSVLSHAMSDDCNPPLPRKTAKVWDQFPDSPREIVSDSMVESRWYDASLKAMHLLAFLLTFVVVLGAATVSKGSLLFMTSQVSHNQTKPYCNARLDRNRQFVVALPLAERVAWIWMLFYAYCVPQLGIFVRSVRVCAFKHRAQRHSRLDFLLVLLTETLPAMGSALLVYEVLPQLDVLKGAMLTNGVCFVPGLISAWMGKKLRPRTAPPKFALDCLATAMQATALVAWPLVAGTARAWLIPVALLCVAAGYWENFFKWGHYVTAQLVDHEEDDAPFARLAKQRMEFTNARYFIYAFVSIWKIVVFFVTMLLYFWIMEGDAAFLFERYEQSMNAHPIFVAEIAPVITSSLANIDEMVATGAGTWISSDRWTPVYVLLVNVLSTYVCYVFGKFACKILVQGFGYAFPLNLTMPLAISALIAMCGAFAREPCAYAELVPPYLFFDVPAHMHRLERFVVDEWAWAWLLWVLSQAWITRHVWTPTSERLARTERLYMRPMYDPFLIDQDVALNRRKEVRVEAAADDDDAAEASDDVPASRRRYDDGVDDGAPETTRIYACGTMWHETKEEMMAFLKSVLHLDADQCARRIASIEFHVEKDYYQLETHVFFDDAFVRYDDDPRPHLNDYVNTLVDAVDEARRDVHEIDAAWEPPIKSGTPYGGRLAWQLPGGSRLIAHLKDKKKIRAKKRWSQVMYMYYLLGHRLMGAPCSVSEKEARARNTFLLALDGDIDFQPRAVLLLVDLMRRSRTVGAACGRIHPIGSGPMVWYQIFEYAVGHWLQKATEHVIGCVLCSPGCFSLFRGSALMEDNVMKKYTTQSSAARHFVQYDQGEDRWLCTLLLQRGFRVEYSAASDAYTHCPEGFNEFYNQRRRWMPSTTANIFDLLNDYKHITRTNENISMLYIAYQGVMMVGTVLGPGTIFLMLVGAFVAAFRLDQWTSFLWNAVPILSFMTVCKLFSQSSVQLFVAGLLSAIYGLVMMAVLVGVLMQIQQDGILSPSSLFFFFIAAEFVVTALMHPKEVGCLMYGVIYYVTVPSMYLLLVIYSVFNMNVISWGTRETVIATKKEQAATDEAAARPQTATKKVLSLLGATGSERTGAFSLSIANLFSCLLCTDSISPEQERLLQIQNSLEAIRARLGMIEKQAEIADEPRFSATREDDDSAASSVAEDWQEDGWLYEGKVKMCTNDELNADETDFWRDLIEKYLQPDALSNDSKEKQQIKKDLEDLRDKSVAAFFMINALFVLVVFLLTLKKDILHIDWPFNVKTNFSYNGDTRQIEITKEYLQLEPIGFVFLIFFGILMVVQFLAMFQHRFETMCQILANMEFNIGWCEPTARSARDERTVKQGERWVNLVKEMQRLKPVDNGDDYLLNGVSGRKTITNNERIKWKEANAATKLTNAYQAEYIRQGDEYEKGKKIRGGKHGINIRDAHIRKTVIKMDPRKTVYGGDPDNQARGPESNAWQGGDRGIDNSAFLRDSINLDDFAS